MLRERVNSLSSIALTLVCIAGLGVALLSDAQEPAAPAAPAQALPAPTVPGPVPASPAQPSAPPAASPEAPARTAPDNAISEIVMLQWAEPETVANLIQLFGVEATAAKSQVRAVVLRGAPAAMAAAKEAVKQLDVQPKAEAPDKNVELTVYLLLAGKGEAAPAGDPCPAQLQGVVDQIRQVFGAQSTALLDTLLLRGREGSRIEAAGTLKTPDAQGQASSPLADKIASLVTDDAKLRQDLVSLIQVRQSPSEYKALVDRTFVTNAADGTPVIRLDDFVFGCEYPFVSGNRSISRQEVGLKACLDIKQGQPALVGKASLGASGEVAYVVVSARVLPD